VKRTLVVRPEAEADLSEAYKWYERQRPGLGDDFLLRIEAALASIQHDPLTYACLYRDVRRKLIRRFPFGLFYIVTDSRIVILAVMHVKRHPKRWRRRR
jgi:plasmid stabilization system protein ParE